MVKSLQRLSYFYMHESCGQCTPCREGTGWLSRMVDRIETGHGRPATWTLLDNVAENIHGPHHLRPGRRGRHAGARHDQALPRTNLSTTSTHKTCMVPAVRLRRQ